VKRSLKPAAIVLGLVMLSGSFAFADHQFGLIIVNQPPSGERVLYNRNELLRQDDTYATAHLPVPADAVAGSAAFLEALSDSLVSKGAPPEAMSMMSALPSVRGGDMMSPQDRADQQIRQLIRRLD